MLRPLHTLSTRARLALLAVVVCLAAGATYAGLAVGNGDGAAARAAVRQATPSAAAFGRDFVATANAYARSHGHVRRLASPHCVQASRGHYMCAYKVVRPRRADCHLMQALWTPGAESAITVTLAGKTSRCGSLRDAVHSLGLGP